MNRIVLLLCIFLNLFHLRLIVAAGTKDDGLSLHAPHAAVIGKEEVVFNWTQDRCEDLDTPDTPARVFVNSMGLVNLIAASHRPYRSVGYSLNNLKRDCASGAILDSIEESPDPGKHVGKRWLASPYSIDGTTIIALVHNEYHGQDHGNCDPLLNGTTSCWYNSITFVKSTDGGKKYEMPPGPHPTLVFSLPFGYGPNQPAYGYFEPTNIVKHRDGYYYVGFHAERFGNQRNGMCIARTKDLNDPTTWRAWNGEFWAIQFIDPLRVEDNPAYHICSPVGVEELGFLHGSLAWSQYYGQYILIGEIDGEFYLSGTRDFLHWAPRIPLPDMKTLCPSDKPGTTGFCTYPSLLEPFEIIPGEADNINRIGRSPFLYYTKFMDSDTLNRNLHRVQIRFE